MNLFVIIILNLVSTFAFAQADSYADKITFLGTNQYSIQSKDVATEFNFEIDTYNLDAIKNLEKEISQGLPKDPVKAQEIANKRLDKVDQSKTMHMFQGTALLFTWDIKKLPAFVFGEGEFVIYGVTDTQIAIKRYLNSRRR